MSNKEKRELVRALLRRREIALSLLDQIVEKAEQEDRESWMLFHLKELKELALSIQRWRCGSLDVRAALNLLDQIIEKAELESWKGDQESWMLSHLKTLKELLHKRENDVEETLDWYNLA